MQFALNQLQERIKPAPKITGFCPSCGDALIPKCGQILCWHWSHKILDCDPWHEPESEWHRNWKGLFPDDWQEVTMENHRADIKTPFGVVEFQASPISSVEVQERENFYGKMIWVLKADKFKLCRELSPVSKNLYYKRIIPTVRGSGDLLALLSMNDEQAREEEEEAQYRAQYNNKIWHDCWRKDPMYRWRWPKTTWRFARKKIYLDKGNDEIFHVQWLSPDCKYIKGRTINKSIFVSQLLHQ